MKISTSIKGLAKMATEMAKRVNIFPQGGKIIFLHGEMGTGKTTFSRYFGEYFNITLSSPTYAVIEEHQLENNTVIHADFYRIDEKRSEEILSEYIEKNPNAIFLLEWTPEALIDEYFRDVPHIHIYFEHGNNPESRDINIQYKNPFSVSKEKAQKILDEYKTPVHIKNHIEVVRTVAIETAQRLLENNIPIDINLVEESAILHDALKYVDFSEFQESDRERYKEEVTQEKIEFWKEYQKKYKKIHHGKAMAIELEERGFFATAKVVESHITGTIFRVNEMSWEEKCVYYADKCALHDTRVSVEERLKDGAKRYGYDHSPELDKKVLDLEKELLMS